MADLIETNQKAQILESKVALYLHRASEKLLELLRYQFQSGVVRVKLEGLVTEVSESLQDQALTKRVH